MKNRLHKLFALLLVCTLCVCGFAGCGSDPIDSDTETTVSDETTTTLGDVDSTDVSSSDATGSKTTKPTASTQPSKSDNTASAQDAAEVYSISVGGTLLSDFDTATKNYTYYLDAGTKTAPQVTATKTGGTGDLQVTQATTPNGAAKVSLNGTTYTVQFVLRISEADMLKNTYYKLKTTKKLNVAYLGGSVTSGYGATSGDKSWRSQITAWLKSQYKDATITETNAGIGGTGTMYGAHRTIQDLKLKSETEKPDLVFIEFASNDYSDVKSYGYDPVAYMESIVRTIYQYAPQADIVMVFITSYNTKGTDFNTKVAHRQVADAYNIPFIDVGLRLWNEILQESGNQVAQKYQDNKTWLKYYNDSVHPNDNGYAKYTAYIKETLTKAFAAKTAVPSGCVKSYMPAKTLATLPASPYVANFKGASASGFTVDEQTGYAVATGSAKFTIKFTGTDLRLWIYGDSQNSKNNTKLYVTVDGGKRQTIEANCTNHKILTLAEGLSNGEHTVQVTVTPAASGSKAYLDIRNFLITGDPSMRGITLS